MPGRVVSFCWFRHGTSNRSPRYFDRVAWLALWSARRMYPSARIVLHADAETIAHHKPGLRTLVDAGAISLIECAHGDGLAEASLWRLKPAWSMEPEDVLLPRDIDSICTPREVAMVERWERDGVADMLCVNDCETHRSRHDGYALLGTMGIRAVALRSAWPTWDAMMEDLRGCGPLDWYGADEVALNAALDAFDISRVRYGAGDGRAWPDPMPWAQYVGMVAIEYMDAAEAWLEGLECGR